MHARLLFVSTKVSPIGAGDGGGVETTLKQITPILAAKGYQVTVLAPTGSRLPPGALICEINGTPPPNATTSVEDSAVIIGADGVLEGMWQQAAQMQDRFDVIISMSYDWLSYDLTPFLSIPVLHWVTIGSCLRVVDTAIAAIPDHAYKIRVLLEGAGIYFLLCGLASDAHSSGRCRPRSVSFPAETRGNLALGRKNIARKRP